jgi:hypothetical protein
MFVPYFIKDPKGYLKLDSDVLKWNNSTEMFDALQTLNEKGYIGAEGVYGDPLIVKACFTGGVLYSSDLFGQMVITYKTEDDSFWKPFVQGVTILRTGKTTLRFTIKASGNNEKIVKDFEVRVGQAKPEWIEEPTAKTDLVFNDRYQELVNPGKAVGGTVYYAIDGGSALKWSKEIPTAKDATDTTGTDVPYKVLYKLVPDSDNYDELTSEKYVLYVSIASKSADADEDTDDDEVDFLAPSQVKLVTVTNKGKKSAVVNFKRIKEATYYEYVITDKNGKKVQEGKVDQDVTKIIKVKVKGLAKNTKYKVKVRAIATYNDGDHFGEWSKTVSFKTKKN